MHQRERFVIAGILCAVAVLVGFDIFTDSREGVVLWHILIEGTIGIFALAGVFYLLRGTVVLIPVSMSMAWPEPLTSSSLNGTSVWQKRKWHFFC
jgi:hypothetical protein